MQNCTVLFKYKCPLENAKECTTHNVKNQPNEILKVPSSWNSILREEQIQRIRVFEMVVMKF